VWYNIGTFLLALDVSAAMARSQADAGGKAPPEGRLASPREVTIIQPSVLSRAVRSLYFRRHLASAIPALEATVWEELASRQVRSALIGGFRVCVNETSLSIEPASSVHPGQLWLPGVSGSSRSLEQSTTRSETSNRGR
jgi:hypothetical protein